LERGLGYIALGPADAAESFARSASRSGKPYLWFTEHDSDSTPDGSRIVRVTSLADAAGGIDPKRLQDLRPAAAAFLGDAAEGVVLLDCVDYLILHNGAERVQRALADLHDEVTMHGGSLVVFVDARGANPRLVAWLQRELDPLPPAQSAFSPGEGMLA
jgi:hypothetical protein